jgi:hypothetical protein
MTKPRFAVLFSLLLLLLLAGCSNQGATITWETASEVDTAGFNLYRATSPDGPWQKINEQLIPPSEDPVSGGSYKFVDKSAEPGKTYYYQLEEVALSGTTTRFDPIELQTAANTLSWPWWIAGAVVAIGLGWLLGSLFGRKKTHEPER